MRCVSSRHRKKGPRATTPLFANPRSSERSSEIGTVGVSLFLAAHVAISLRARISVEYRARAMLSTRDAQCVKDH